MMITVTASQGIFSQQTYEDNKDRIDISFSQLSIEEDKDVLMLEIEGTNDLFIKENNYILPTYEKTLNYPFGTHIETIEGDQSYGD